MTEIAETNPVIQERPLIYEQMLGVMKEVESITKDRKNENQGYKFRGIDDVYNQIHDILSKWHIFMTSQIMDERTEQKVAADNRVIFYRLLRIKYRFYTLDGSYVESEVIGEGMDTGDKGFAKAHSIAHKYCLLQAFCIPTDDPKDPENDHFETVVTINQIESQSNSNVSELLIPPCPKCKGFMFDNRATKTNPKQPDFKCKNKSCGWAIWPEKEN